MAAVQRKGDRRVPPTIADLEKSWVETGYAPFHPFVTWTPEGPRFGAATLLKRHGRGTDDRLLALLSVAHARAVPTPAAEKSGRAPP
jgi:hypothetical protein